jgi:hypothetical protein
MPNATNRITESFVHCWKAMFYSVLTIRLRDTVAHAPFHSHATNLIHRLDPQLLCSGKASQRESAGGSDTNCGACWAGAAQDGADSRRAHGMDGRARRPTRPAILDRRAHFSFSNTNTGEMYRKSQSANVTSCSARPRKPAPENLKLLERSMPTTATYSAGFGRKAA